MKWTKLHVSFIQPETFHHLHDVLPFVPCWISGHCKQTCLLKIILSHSRTFEQSVCRIIFCYCHLVVTYNIGIILCMILYYKFASEISFIVCFILPVKYKSVHLSYSCIIYNKIKHRNVIYLYNIFLIL